MNLKKRLDIALVEAGMAQSRSQASQYIKEGAVYVNGKEVRSSSTKVAENTFTLKKDIIYVGRGAYKIEGALKKFNIDVRGKLVADVGASTGGFSDYILKNGGKKVWAIDVGHGQLAKSLREDSRVVNLERVNIRDGVALEEKVDLAVADLSYISLKLCLKAIFDLVKDGGDIITLVKPQFEVGKEGLGKKGIVKNLEKKRDILNSLYLWCEEQNYFIGDAMASPIEGKTGNQEFFFYFKKGIKESGFDVSLLGDLVK